MWHERERGRSANQLSGGDQIHQGTRGGVRATGRLIARPNNTLALSSGERHASAAAGALPSSSAPQPPGSKRAYGCAGRHAAHAEPQPQPNNFQASCWATRGARGRHLTPWAPQRAPTPAWPPRAPRVASTSSAPSRPLSTPPGASIRLIAALGATTPPPTRRFHAARARAHAPRRPRRHQQVRALRPLRGHTRLGALPRAPLPR